MKIEKNLPIEGLNKSRGRSPIYPFRDMDVGDSIFVKGQKLGGGAYQSAVIHGNKYGKKFSGRTVEGGIRIWRVQ